MTEHETPLAAKFIGTEFQKEEVPDADRIFAYFASYGTPAFELDEIHHLSDRFPKYPTDAVLRVELDEIDESTMEIVRARRIDTSNPSKSRGEWYDGSSSS